MAAAATKGLRMNEDSRVFAERGPFEMVPHWLLYEKGVNALGIRLYLILRQHSDNDGLCFPSRQRLAELLNVSLPTLDKARNELEVVGAMCMTVRRGAKQERLSTLYHLHWHRRNDCAWGSKDIWQGSKESYTRTNTHLTNTQVRTNTAPTELDEILESHARKQPNAMEVAAPTRTRGKTRKRTSVTYSADYLRFWAAYPRKVGKRAAAAAFQEALDDGVSADEIIAGAERYANDPNRDAEFTAHPTTWLRRGSWEDDPLPARKGKQTGGQARMQGYEQIYRQINSTKGAIEQ